MKKYNAIDSLLAYNDTSLGFAREVSCFAVPYDGIISATSNNSAGSVDFDWFTIKDAIWKIKDAGDAPEVAYMLHTHPFGLNRMSSVDRNMVHGWCLALGIPIWFLVVTEDEIASYICSFNKDTKQVERDLVDLSYHKDVCGDLKTICEVMYGLSKTDNFNDEILRDFIIDIKASDLNFNNINKWNETREWNQVTYMES